MDPALSSSVLAMTVLLMTASPSQAQTDDVEVGGEVSPRTAGQPERSTGAEPEQSVPAVQPEGRGTESTSSSSSQDQREPVFNVTVRAKASNRPTKTSEAVDVVSLAEARARTDDLTEALTRQSAVQVQRTGASGSGTQLSLAGLSGDQVRVLIDGLPIDYSPFAFGLGNVPVSLIQQLEVFNGVVPVRLATDALGGAINARTDVDAVQNSLSFSLLGGSFDTFRGSTHGAWFHPSEKLFARALAFHDRARNDYVVTVDVADIRNQLSPARVHRHNDAYLASGVQLEAGLAELPWAERLALQLYFAQYDKEIPHNPVMTTPWGEVSQQRRSLGVTARYAVRPAPWLRLSANVGVNRRFATLHDTSTCAYDWYGRCVAERPLGGEISGTPLDLWTRFDTAFVRTRAQLSTWHADDLELSLGVDSAGRRGRNAYLQAFDYYDPNAVPVNVVPLTGGISHRQDLFGARAENVVFAKAYRQAARYEADPRAPVAQSDRLLAAGGAGDTLRVLLTRKLALKTSYEYTARLPRVEECSGPRFSDHPLIWKTGQLRDGRSCTWGRRT